jgi:hypothetical protein
MPYMAERMPNKTEQTPDKTRTQSNEGPTLPGRYRVRPSRREDEIKANASSRLATLRPSSTNRAPKFFCKSPNTNQRKANYTKTLRQIRGRQQVVNKGQQKVAMCAKERGEEI